MKIKSSTMDKVFVTCNTIFLVLFVTITLATFLGDFICYEIQLSNGQIIEANEYTDRMRIVRSVGDEVGLRFVEERINVFDAETEESIMQ